MKWFTNQVWDRKSLLGCWSRRSNCFNNEWSRSIGVDQYVKRTMMYVPNKLRNSLKHTLYPDNCMGKVGREADIPQAEKLEKHYKLEVVWFTKSISLCFVCLIKRMEIIFGGQQCGIYITRLMNSLVSRAWTNRWRSFWCFTMWNI